MSAVDSAVAEVSVRDMSFLDVDGQRGTRRGRPARVVGLLGRRIGGEQHDDAVVVALVEHLGAFITQFPDEAQTS